MVLVHDTSSHEALQMCQVLSKYLKRFSSYRAEQFETDRQKQYVS